jgi:putative NADH-flavin reductase
MLLNPGVRTGHYRVGADAPLWAEGGAPGSISVQDMAVAIVDEIETPKHIQKRFTVAN